ncbi:MAG: hypothetical protein HXX16_20610, partial [Bacteroidales bacterium]|nr:hypothetical protein [Bacteroidales bacterium]
DKKALPDPEGNIETTHEYIAPNTEIEKQLANTWQELLSVDKVGIHSNFFDLGGHSLLIIVNNQKIKELFNVEIPISMYYHSTLEQIAIEINNLIKQKSI